MDFQQNLSTKYNFLTKQGKRLADYIRENQEQVVRMTAKALGEASGTSAATVIRVSNQLGYESFELMKISLAKAGNHDELNSPIDTVFSATDSLTDVMQKLYQNRLNALNATMELVNTEEIKKAVVFLQKAKRIFLFGVGSAGLVAQEFCNRLNRIGKTCLYLNDGHTNLQFATIVEKGDVVIAFSYSGETKEVNLAAEKAFRNDVPVIALTRNRANSLSAWATALLPVPDIERRVRIGSILSTSSLMLMVDILYSCLLQRDLNKYENKLVETAKMANRLRE